MARTHPSLPSDYGITLKSIEKLVRQVRTRVILSANTALITLYWEIGRTILERQTRAFPTCTAFRHETWDSCAASQLNIPTPE
jgi:hypothetical protein